MLSAVLANVSERRASSLDRLELKKRNQPATRSKKGIAIALRRSGYSGRPHFDDRAMKVLCAAVVRNQGARRSSPFIHLGTSIRLPEAEIRALGQPCRCT